MFYEGREEKRGKVLPGQVSHFFSYRVITLNIGSIIENLLSLLNLPSSFKCFAVLDLVVEGLCLRRGRIGGDRRGRRRVDPNIFPAPTVELGFLVIRLRR
jgi:hypothetical protein